MIELIALLEHPVFGPGFIFVLGLIFGSFFNVVILRLPEKISLVKEGSRCPKCKKPVKWYCNIPVISYIALLGKCRDCKAKISIQYPLVELFTGALFLALYYKFGVSLQFLVYALFVSSLIVISVIDLHLQIIPDEISLPGIPLGFALCFVTGDISWMDSLMGILLGGGVFLLIAWGYERFLKREGLGGGDIKLLGMIGAWLGIKSLLPVIVISSFLGSVIGIGLILLKGKNFKSAIPFGPFLALGAMGYLFYAEQITEILFPTY